MFESPPVELQSITSFLLQGRSTVLWRVANRGDHTTGGGGEGAKSKRKTEFVRPKKNPRCLIRPHAFYPEGETLAAALAIIDTANYEVSFWRD